MQPSSPADIQSATREILWNIESPAAAAVMYSLFALSLGICAFGVWQRVRFWCDGRPDASRFNNRRQRFLHLLWELWTQHSVNRDSRARVHHGLIVSGFLVLLFATTMVFLDYDFGLNVFHGPFYLMVSLLADVFGLALFVGAALAYHHRFIEGHDRLHRTTLDRAVLLLLGALAVQGFILEALRISAVGDPWAAYSPVGALLSKVFWSFSTEALTVLHAVLWWIHTLTAFTFIAVLPYTRLLHLLTSPANVYFRRLSQPKGSLSYPGDIEHIMEEAMADESGDESLQLGASSLADLTWKQRLDLDACTSCGRCQDVCPAYRSGKPLSPKWLVLDIRDHSLNLQANHNLLAGGDAPANPSLLEKLDAALLAGGLLEESVAGAADEKTLEELQSKRAVNPLVQKAARSPGQALNAELAAEVMDPDVFWSCTTCRACMEFCPVAIEHVDLITDVRRGEILMQGRMPQEAQAALRSIEARGNPFGSSDDRMAWAKGLEVPVLDEGAEVEVLYWVGCTAAFDSRKQKIARAMAQILNASGVSWGVLGNKERCNGDPARRLGEELLFQTAAKENIHTLRSVSYSVLLSHCPHCVNVFRNEYPQIDADIFRDTEVVHHSEFIAKLIASEKLSLARSIPVQCTYHDPCYLGRYNDCYNDPRALVEQSTGLSLREMADSYERGLCCGAGGGHFWMDLKTGERINVLRAEQAVRTGAEVIATSCPFCMHMLEDAVGLIGRDSDLGVQDIAELVAGCLE